MKKTLIAIVVIVSIGVLNSCNKQPKTVKEVVNTTPKTRDADLIHTQSGFLKFKNRDVFDSMLIIFNRMSDGQLDSLENSLSFESLRTKMDSDRVEGTNYNKDCDDDILLRILDNDGIVQVGDYIFKSETDYGLCWTLNVRDINTQLSNLRSRSFIEGAMNRFNDQLEDDVYDLLLSDTVGIYQSPTRGVDKDKKNDDVTSTGSNPTVWRADCKNVYEAAVFYYSLLSELKSMYKPGVLWTTQTTTIQFLNTTYVTYKPHNRSSQGPYYPSFSAISNNKLNWRPYGASRRLVNFKLYTQFAYYCWAPGMLGTRFVNLDIYK